MPEKIITVIQFFELKIIMPFGFIAGFLAPFDGNIIRILVSILGTIAGGTVWVFLKPMVIKLRNKVFNSKKIKK